MTDAERERGPSHDALPHPRLIHAALAPAIVAWASFASAVPAPGPAAGNADSGWFVIGGPPFGPMLMRLPSDEPPGTVRQSMPLASIPSLIASHRGQVIMVYPPAVAEGEEARWLVRLVEPPSPNSPGRTRPLPPLPAGATPTGIVLLPAGAMVLTTTPTGAAELLRLEPARWVAVELPDGFSPAGDARLVSLSDAPALWQDDPTNNRATLWCLSDAGRWTGTVMPAAGSDSTLLVLDRQIISVRRPTPGRMEAWLLRPGGSVQIASLDLGGAEHWIVPAGGVLSVIWISPADAPRLHAAVYSIAGMLLHQGPALTTPPVARRELEWLALALASIVLTVGVYVFRPNVLSAAPVNLPPTVALAEPWRRAAAGLADAAIAFALAWLIWRLSAGTPAGLAAVLRESGARLVSLALIVGIAASTASQWALGRTLGQALFACRTVDSAGRRPPFRLILATHAVRFLCPPFALAWLVETPHRPMRLFGLLVVIDRGPDSSQTDADPPPRQP